MGTLAVALVVAGLYKIFHKEVIEWGKQASRRQIYVAIAGIYFVAIAAGYIF